MNQYLIILLHLKKRKLSSKYSGGNGKKIKDIVRCLIEGKYIQMLNWINRLIIKYKGQELLKVVEVDQSSKEVCQLTLLIN